MNGWEIIQNFINKSKCNKECNVLYTPPYINITSSFVKWFNANTLTEPIVIFNSKNFDFKIQCYIVHNFHYFLIYI